MPAGEVVGVTELASRRRRWGPRLLVAAASVSVLAVGVGVAVQDLGGSGGDSAMSSGASADRQGGSDARDQAGAPGAREGGAAGPGAESGRGPNALPVPVPLHTASLREDLQRVEDAGVAEPVASSGRRWQQACVHPPTGAGDAWARVRLDGRPGVVVLRAPAGDRRTAEVFACGRPGSPVASTTVETR